MGTLPIAPSLLHIY